MRGIFSQIVHRLEGAGSSAEIKMGKENSFPIGYLIPSLYQLNRRPISDGV